MSPDISVIIPTYNRSSIISACLDALCHQTLDPARFEIIVSDDGSQDDTAHVVAECAQNAPVRISYLRQSNSGGATARNRAIQSANGRIMLIINDDSIAIPELLERHLETHERYTDDYWAVLGRVTISPKVPPSLFSALHLDATFCGFHDGQELDWRAFITCNISVKKAFLDAHGLFDERMRYPMHDDIELGERLSHHGLRVRYVADALCYHDHLLLERDFLKQADRDGRELVRWYRIAPALLPILSTLGLYGDPPFRLEFRHRVADFLIQDKTYPLALSVARQLSKFKTSAALFMYRRIFQDLKRRAIRLEMRAAAANGSEVPM